MKELWILDALAEHERGGRVTLASLGDVAMFGKPFYGEADFTSLISGLQEVSVADHPVLNPGNSVPNSSRFFEPIRFCVSDGSHVYVWTAEYRHATPGNFFGESVVDSQGFVVTRDPTAKSDLRPVFVQNHLSPHGHLQPRQEDKLFSRLVSEVSAARQTSHITHLSERYGNGRIPA